MKQCILLLFSIILCFNAHSQSKIDKTLTSDDTLLIVLGRATTIGITARFKSKIARSYLGSYLLTSYYETQQNWEEYEDYKYKLTINVHQSSSEKGRYKAIYTLVDEVNQARVRWVFYDDRSTPNAEAFFNKLNLVASDLELGYKHIFPENQKYKSTVPKELKLDTLSIKSESIYECMKATILISSDVGQGSGFFIDSKYSVTNYHVVGNKKSVTCTDHLGNEFQMRVIRTDREHDLALLQTKDNYKSGYSFYTGEQLDSNLVGIAIYTIGTPASKELINSVSGGIISGWRTLEELEVIQINAPVNPGNSGGPLIDSEGNLIGIVVAKIAGLANEGIAFAISKDQLFESFNIRSQ